MLNTIKNNWGKSQAIIFLFGDSMLHCHNGIDILLLTNKLNLKCYVLYVTKGLLSITKMSNY